MPNAFERTFNERVIPAANRGFGVSVTLYRGIDVTEPFTARRNDQVYKAIGQEYGIEVSINMRDFYLPTSAIVFGGIIVEPRTGDRICEGDETYEIQPPDIARPSVELQAGGYEYIVHTKKVE